MRLDYCPECNCTDVDYIDDMDMVSTAYMCSTCYHIFDYDDAKHVFIDNKVSYTVY